jgi:hypothetical protein
MPRVQQMHLGLGDVVAVGDRSGDGEREVVLAPQHERRRPHVAKVCPPLRIRRDVGSVVEKEVELGCRPSRVG